MMILTFMLAVAIVPGRLSFGLVLRVHQRSLTMELRKRALFPSPAARLRRSAKMASLRPVVGAATSPAVRARSWKLY